jgi:NAD(P)-dependent dehydrogenase (short-subunit alcohol dehydrogenase family)
MRLKRKIAIVTGAARGIGAAFAATYVREGATIAIADIDMAGAEQTAKAIGPSAFAIRLDVADQASIDAAVAGVEKRCGGIDILINNAALFDMAPIVEITRTSYDRLFSINVAGTFFTLQAVARSMIKNKHKGKIINMASQAGRRGEALVAVYCATKASVISLTQSAGLDLSSSMVSMSMRLPPAWLMASIGKAWMRSLPSLETFPLVKGKHRWLLALPTGAWGPQKISSAWRFFWHRKKAIISSPRHTMLTAANG